MKIKQLQQYLKKNKINLALFITRFNIKDYNFFYFTKLHESKLNLGILIIPKSKQPFILVPGFEYVRIKEFIKKHKIKLKIIEMKKTFLEDIQKITGKPKIIGINQDTTTINGLKKLKRQFKKVKFTDINPICQELREQKTEDEIKLIKKACNITDKIMQNCIKNFKKFKTEKDVVNFLEKQTKKNKCKFAFPPHVASGSNGYHPHHLPNKNKIKKGLCIIDFGVKYKGYCSDMTRTIWIGHPKGQEMNDYRHVLDTQFKTIKRLKIGMKLSEIEKIARFELDERAKLFIHSIGHGIGLEIHENPRINHLNKNKLKENMIFTIEPGIYLKNKYGIRIEDDILMTKKGPKFLTKTDKWIKIIK
ncbi:M24 family metallopeptidase [Nanoarchaeota archaeon]